MASTLRTEFAHLQIPLEHVLKATNNFSDKYIIGKGGFGNVYRGKLKNRDGNWIKIAARRLDRKHGQGEAEFWTEVSMLSSLKHENIVSMIGFCDENGEKIIIHRRYSRGSLIMHLNNTKLGWFLRSSIADKIIDVILYLHNIPGESYHIIHRNINSSTILLDENWQPKLSGFEFSVKHPNDRMNQVLVCEPIGSQGYIDPEIHKTGGVTYKSDIYSMGVVFFEMLCGRKAFMPNNHDNKFLVPLARSHYDNNTLQDIISYDLWNAKDRSEYIRYISQYAFLCTFGQRKSRHEADILKHVVPPESKDPNESGGSCKSLTNSIGSDNSGLQTAYFEVKKVKKVEHLRIGLEVIKLATSNFSKGRLHSCHRCSSYKCQLECIDREYMFGVNTKNKDHHPKRTYNVFIKHIKNGEYNFDTEIENLSSCKHRNIQSFLGFCDEGSGMILVFEYVPNTRLSLCLKKVEFTWEKRLKVCLDIAHGLCYLQNGMKDQKMIIHCDITSWTIKLAAKSEIVSESRLVPDSWEAYIADFQHAILAHRNQPVDAHALQLNDNREMTFYTDPEYVKSGKLKVKSDIYSFGVVLFEILCGMRVDDLMFKECSQDRRLEQVVGPWLKKGIMKNKVAFSLKQENSDNLHFLHKGLNNDSLDTFIAIAYRCLAKRQNKRPTIQTIIRELEKSLSFQTNHKAETFKMSLEDIKVATKDFSCVIGKGGFGSVYIGEVAQKHSYGHCAIVAKKLDTRHGQGLSHLYNELHILYKYKHENVIGLVGYSDETDEKLIIYERAPKGSLDVHLKNVELTWRKRLLICIDIASALDFLHGAVKGQEVVIHRDIKTPNILLFDDWKAKLGDFGLSLISNIDIDEGKHYTIDRACGTIGYVDPLYLETGLLTIESDIYSFGVVLFEIMCGKATYKIPDLGNRSLVSFIRQKLEEGKQDEIVFRGIKEEIVPKSLATFIRTVCKCIDDDRGKRPTTKEVLAQLKKALQLQINWMKKII